jgi:hypothetical protein
LDRYLDPLVLLGCCRVQRYPVKLSKSSMQSRKDREIAAVRLRVQCVHPS